MKNLIKILLTTIIFSSLSSLPAHAETYAVVDENGLVTNIIACDASVCGANGTWSGVMPNDNPLAGQRLILQVPVNSVTGENQGGYYNPQPKPGEPDITFKYDSQAQEFFFNAEPVVTTEIVETTTLKTIVYPTVLAFGPNNFKNNKMEFTSKTDTNTVATIFAQQGAYFENKTYSTSQTVEQLRESLTEDLGLLRENLNKLIALLKSWVKN
jgi:hypothetical protein